MTAATPLTHGEPLRGLSTPALRVLETRHRAGLRLGWHEHEQACINFVLEGCYAEELGLGEDRFEPLSCLFKGAGEAHANHFEGAGARCLLIEIRDPGLLAPEVDLGGVLWTRAPDAAALALRLWREAAVADELSALSADEWGAELYERVLGARAHRAPAERVARACELLHDGWREPWTLSAMARAVGLHPSHLARAFRARHGCTIGEYLRAARVNEVARRLAFSDEPISELSAEAGFADQSHCTRAFRRRLGTTPGAFRRALRR